MAVFHSTDDLQSCLGRLYDAAKNDPRVAPSIQASNLIIQFRYTNPTAVVTILADRPPTQPNALFDVMWGELPEIRPDVTMSMQADIAHQFWHGKINLMAALARRQIVARGPIPSILRLLPAVTPMYSMYPQILVESGQGSRVLS